MEGEDESKRKRDYRRLQKPRQSQVRLFSTINWEDGLAQAEQSGDYTMLVAPGSESESQSQGPSNSQQQGLGSHQEPRDYKALLAPPDVRALRFWCSRLNTASVTVKNVAVKDFLARGPLPEVTRRGIGGGRSSRLRTWERRLVEFRGFFDYSVPSNPEWAEYTCFPAIVSLTPGNTGAGIWDDNEGDYVWDEKQGVAFKQTSEPVVLVGYIVKVGPPMVHRLSRASTGLGVLPIRMKSLSSKPGLYLEDGTARIKLNLAHQRSQRQIRNDEIVSGVPVAVKGISVGGEFWVDDVMYATPSPMSVSFESLRNEVDIMFISGLCVGQPGTDLGLMELLSEYLLGFLGSEFEQAKVVSRLTRLIIVGNLFPKRPKYDAEKKEEIIAVQNDVILQVDEYLSRLTKHIEVFLVPGHNEPVHQKTLPTPPVPKRMFPKASEDSTFHCLTNPSKVCLDMSIEQEAVDPENILSLVLTSGGNVKETMKECAITCPFEMCSKLLEWSHLCPTSVNDGEIVEEIFTLATLPHLFVIGTLSDFRLQEWNGVRLLAIPSFFKTGIAVTLGKNGDIRPISFKMRVK